MCEPVDERDGAGCVGEDAVPLREGQVGRDDDRASGFVPSGDNLEEQVCGAVVVGHVAELIDDEQGYAAVVAHFAFEL